MQRIQPVNPAEAKGKAKQLLDGVQAKLGMTPNMTKTMAQSPAALDAYLAFNGALAAGVLDAKFREQIALAVAQANQCEYCLAAHTAIGGMCGLAHDQVAAAREARGADTKTDAGLKFAQELVARHGEIANESLQRIRAARFSDGEIAEIVAHVALNIYTNYFNIVAGTEVDFPRVGLSLRAA
jgi:uncharacterized peroxidase-related enzyme